MSVYQKLGEYDFCVYQSKIKQMSYTDYVTMIQRTNPEQNSTHQDGMNITLIYE